MSQKQSKRARSRAKSAAIRPAKEVDVGYGITRRHFLAAAGVGFAALAGYLGWDRATSSVDNILHADEIAARQRELDALYHADPSPHIISVQYLPNQVALEDAVSRCTKRIATDPRYIDYMADLIEENLATSPSRETLVHLLREPEQQKLLEARVSKGFLQHMSAASREPAGTPLLPVLFGHAVPSEIYVFKPAFNAETRDVGEKSIRIPVETKLRIVYKHEWFHARHFAEGISMGDVSITSSNFRKLNPLMQQLVVESAAYMDTLAYFAQIAPGSLEHLYASGKENGWLGDRIQAMANVPLPEFEHAVATEIIKRHNSFYAESASLFDQYGKH